MWTGDPADDVTNSSTSTSGHSTPWSASLQRSQARRRLDDLDKDNDDDDDTTPTPNPSRGGPDLDWTDVPSEYRRPVRRRRPPAALRDHQERGRSPHPPPRWEERRSLDCYDPHVLAVVAAAQPWIAAAAASQQCCCSGNHGGGHPADLRPPPPPCGGHGCQMGCRTFTPAGIPRKVSSPCCACWGSSAHCGHGCMDRGAQSPCPTWAGSRCKTPVSGDYGDLQDKVSHLESEKENLALQVSVLTDQLELQKDKLLELEAALAEKKQLLERTEHLLKQEVLLKKKIEADRLDILADIPALKLKVATTEREKSELESKVKKLETDVVLLRSYLAEREAELITKCGKISHHGSVSSVGDGSGLRSTPTKFGAGLDWKEKSPVPCDGGGDKQMCSEREARLAEKPPMCPRSASATLPSNHSALRASTPLQSLHRANSDDGMHMAGGARQYSNSLPRNHGHQVKKLQAPEERPAEAQDSAGGSYRSRKSSTGVSFGKGFFRLRSSRRTCSAPELAQPELVVIRPGCQTYSPPSTSSTLKHSKSRGIKKMFGRLKRSNSHTMDVSDSFHRGGLRATAGPRLGWAPPSQNNTHFSEKPVSQWKADTISSWMESMGLAVYNDTSRSYLCDGTKLLKVTASELEKDLGMKNPLHRKKMLLAVESLKPDASELVRAASLLDWQWTLRWLDDVGLPQYKDAFSDALVDGRVLNVLTVDDLVHMKITNQFHHISMKRGIQVLRLNQFEPSCLKRRSLPDEPKQYSPLDVSLWTNHRVMEWLRTVDLSEYAPNLRGSGVHGALLIYEDAVTCDVFAAILSIPGSKTLLRRHLSLQMKQLLGPRIMQRKRSRESDPGHVPLSPSAKVKTAKKSQFSLRWRKSKSGESQAYVCPFEPDSVVEDVSFESAGDSSLDSSFSSREKDAKTAHEIEAVSNEISSFMKLQEVKNLDSLASTNI
ncbi:unnamed protein product [Ixodes pacificus]